ncbi:MAG: hypothetical protein PHS49_04735 [Candidatus Gracilibacteria bacterium]|nr:hypothetical protein [Candidatus Gracilibacteria bacterium]
MNEQINKQKILNILEKLDINQEFKDIINSKIDLIDLEKLIEIISKYANNLENIEKKNQKIKQELEKMLTKYKNNSEEYFDNRDGLTELEYLINNM